MRLYVPRCVLCGRTGEETGGISSRGLCPDCGHTLMEMNNDQMRNGSGPFYEHWARRRYMGARRRLLALAERDGIDTGGDTA